MKHRFTLSFVLMLFISMCSFSQDNVLQKGKVQYRYDRRLDSLVLKQIRINEQKNTISGFRVQIYFGGQRNKANEIKAEFLKKFPDETAYLLYQQPNFKIRVGDFRDRLKAQQFYLKLLPIFNTAFIVKDEVNLPEFK
jgi:hypothetical protein